MKRRGLSRLIKECDKNRSGGDGRRSEHRSGRSQRKREHLAPPRYVRPEGGLQARHFDHSRPVTLSVSAVGASPYRPFATRDDYDLPRAASFSIPDRRSQPFYVEPFDEETDPRAEAPSVEDARYEDVDATPDKPAPAPVVEAPEDDEEERLRNEEFERDVRRILEGKKHHQEPQRPAAAGPEAPREAPAAPPAEAPSPSKDEHEIFERIAQSMKLANAYDLGSVALKQRFDAFDREIEARRDRAAPHDEHPAPPQQAREFLEDMDEIDRRGRAAEPAQENKGPESTEATQL